LGAQSADTRSEANQPVSALACVRAGPHSLLRPLQATSMKLNVRMKLLATSLVLLAAALVTTAVAIGSLSAVNYQADRARREGTVAVENLRAVNVALVDKARLVTYSVVVGSDATGQATIDASIAADDKAIADGLAAFGAIPLTGREQSDLTAFMAAQAEYQIAFDQLHADARAGNIATATAEIAPAATIRARMMSAIDKLQADVDAVAASINEGVQGTFEQARLLMIVVFLIAVLMGLSVSVVVSRSISGGVKVVQERLTLMTEHGVAGLDQAMAALAANDLTYELVATVEPIERYGTDEIGQTAVVANTMLAMLHNAMRSYEAARASLATTVGEVKTAAEALTRASDQLDSAATQSGNASQQVAQTISQVAAGASDQARAASQTSTASQDLTEIIERVGEGAASTRIRVQDVSRALDATTQAIGQAMRNSESMAPLNERVDAAVAAGAMAVDETAGGMKRIKLSVEGAAARVTELGAKSDQIGAIVETIDDIAEQTNLLALNAAIEAARAGEQGKGFAVVADEVRKLAERSSRATKEIADLITEVQQGTEAAVAAMKTGATEVETGAELAEQAAGALQEIRDAAAARNVVLADMMSAVVEIRTLSADVVRATDIISEIATETNNAAAQMGSAADTVGQSVESIAAISQENSASAEEVSAATEQMSAQAEEVVASAAGLAEMAQGLDELVSRFRLDAREPSAAANVIPRRRASDWQAPARKAG
jgi:methyl-accepting chemotaxis protein